MKKSTNRLLCLAFLRFSRKNPSVSRKYELDWPDEFDDLNIELKCFRYDHKEEDGGLGKAGHFWRIVELLWGKKNKRKHFQIHPWAETMIAQACRWQYLGIAGAGNIGKSDAMALWAIVNWLCDPVNTMVIVTSTTLNAAKNRIWGSIVDYFNSVPDMPGKMVKSLGIIRTTMPHGQAELSDKAGISLVAGEASQEKQSMDKLEGRHNKRVIMIADELPKLSPGLIKFATGNLSKNEWFQFIGIGNPKSKYDPHGLLCTPKDGWDTVSDKDYEWETQLGCCVRFDSELSPNIIAGEVLFSFLPKEADIAISKHRNGEDSLEHWSQCRGFWPPEGSDPECILSEADLVQGDVMATMVEWIGAPIPCASIDPARSSGGDACKMTLGLLGSTASGSRVLMVTKSIQLNDSKGDPRPYNFQIASQFVSICREHGITPENMAYDSTGPAGEIGPIISNMVGNAVLHAVDFNGRASDLTHGIDAKPCGELYADRVSELWLVIKDYIRSGQIKGLTTEIIDDLLARREVLRKQGLNGTKRAVESKKVMRKRIKRSPDAGDSLAILLDLCRKRFRFRSEVAVAQNVTSAENWRKLRDNAIRSDVKALPMNLEDMERGGDMAHASSGGWEPEVEVEIDYGFGQ